jgi:hypothetical protein
MKSKKGVPPAPPVKVTAEERYHLISDAAYFRAAGRRHDTRPDGEDAQAESWCEVAAEIDLVLKKHGAE